LQHRVQEAANPTHSAKAGSARSQSGRGEAARGTSSAEASAIDSGRAQTGPGRTGRESRDGFGAISSGYGEPSRAQRGTPESGPRRSGDTSAGDTSAGRKPFGAEPEEGLSDAPRGQTPPGVTHLRPDAANWNTFPEREALKLALQQPEQVAGGYEQLEVSTFTEPAYAALHAVVLELGGPGSAAAGAAWVERVRDQVSGPVLQSLVSELAVEPLRYRGLEGDGQYAGAILARMAERGAAAHVRELQGALRRAEADGDPVLRDQLQTDLLAWSNYRRQLSDRANRPA
jgi:hypothetical protein